MLQLSQNAKDAGNKSTIRPNLILEIDGWDTIFGLSKYFQIIRVGDPDLFIGDDWVIGGSRTVDGVSDIISLDGTTDSMSQQLDQDKGGTSSVSSIQITLVDKNNEITSLISPGVNLDDIMGKKAWVYLGFNEEFSTFPEDYVIIFAGIIDDVSSDSKITLNVASAEQLKRQQIFPKVQTNLNGAINNSVTTIPLNSIANLLNQKLPEFETYVRIDDEIIRYTGINTGTNSLTGCSRAQFDTIAASHDDDASVESFYRLQDQATDLTLKLMLSNPDNPYYFEDIEIFNFVKGIDGSTNANGIILKNVDAFAKYGLTAGDFVTTTGASTGANNFSLRTVSAVTIVDGSSIITVDGGALIEELDTDATISFSSRYNVLPDGMQIGGDQVDVKEFNRIKDLFFSSLPNYDFYLKDTVQGKEFIDQQILFACNMFTLPRNGRISAGIISPPLAVSSLPVLDSSVLTGPDRIKVRRSLGRYFYNTVAVKYDIDAIDDKAKAGYILVDEDSRNLIKVGARTYTIESQGLRRSADTDAILDINARRLIERYKFAAEYIQCSMFYGQGFKIDVGDVVLFGDEEMPLVDTKNGQRGFKPRLCQVVDKKMSIKSASVTLTIVDTSYLVAGRYGTISPSSRIDVGSSSGKLFLKTGFGTTLPDIETDKWRDFIGKNIVVHDEDYSTSEETTIVGFDPFDNTVMYISPLAGDPPEDYVVDIPEYSDTQNVDSLYKNIFVYTDPTINVVSGTDDFTFDVAIGDVDKILVGSTIIVHIEDYSSTSTEVEVSDVTGTTITVSTSLGFTPDNTYMVDLIGFKDEGPAYRFI